MSEYKWLRYDGPIGREDLNTQEEEWRDSHKEADRIKKDIGKYLNDQRQRRAWTYEELRDEILLEYKVKVSKSLLATYETATAEHISYKTLTLIVKAMRGNWKEACKRLYQAKLAKKQAELKLDLRFALQDEDEDD